MTRNQLALIMPTATKANIDKYCDLIVKWMYAYNIAGNRYREVAYLATIDVESDALKYTREIWGPTEAQKRYEPPSQKAKELGNTKPGDGYKYRGEGLIQYTGKDNFIRLQNETGIPCADNPQIVGDVPEYAVMSSAHYFAFHCFPAADAGDWQKVRRLVNGGLNGYDRFLATLKRAQDVLSKPDFSNVEGGAL